MCYKHTKQISIMIMLMTMGILAGCSKPESKTILFDTYRYDHQSVYTLQEMQGKYLIEHPEILKAYTIPIHTGENNTGFIDSLLIGKIKTTQTGEELIDQIIKTQQNKIPEYEEFNKSSKKITCGTGKIEGYLVQTSIKQGENKNYLDQYFFIDQKMLFTISLFTQDKKNHNLFKTSIKSLECIQTR